MATNNYRDLHHLQVGMKFATQMGRDEKVSLTSTEKKSVVDVVDIDRRPSWRFLGQHRPDWTLLLVDIDHPDIFYWSTSWSTVDAVDIHFTDVFITPHKGKQWTAQHLVFEIFCSKFRVLLKRSKSFSPSASAVRHSPPPSALLMGPPWGPPEGPPDRALCPLMRNCWIMFCLKV